MMLNGVIIALMSSCMVTWVTPTFFILSMGIGLLSVMARRLTVSAVNGEGMIFVTVLNCMLKLTF
jgi:hypothetical protein